MAEVAKAFRREIDLGDGSGVQVFEGDTVDQLLDALAEAQRNATRKIAAQAEELKRTKRQVLSQPASGQDDPDGPIPEYKSRTLSADEEFSLGQRVQNPATARGAIREAIEAELGAPIETVRRTLRRAELTPQEIKTSRAVEAFLLAHPEFENSKRNGDEMVKYMQEKGMALTVTRNYEIAFGVLSAGGFLQLRAPENNGDTQRAAGNGNGAGADSPAAANGTTRPRFASTSIAGRGTGTPRTSTGPKMPTAEEIDRMSASEHKRWLNDPVNGAAFRAHEERLDAEAARRAGRR